MPGRASDTQIVPHLLKTIESLKGALEEKASRPQNHPQNYLNRTSGSNPTSTPPPPRPTANETLYNNYQYPSPALSNGRTTPNEPPTYQYPGLYQDPKYSANPAQNTTSNMKAFTNIYQKPKSGTTNSDQDFLGIRPSLSQNKPGKNGDSNVFGGGVNCKIFFQQTFASFFFLDIWLRIYGTWWNLENPANYRCNL